MNRYWILFIMVMFFAQPYTCLAEEGAITEEYVVRILDGEDQKLNYDKHRPKKKKYKKISFSINFAYNSDKINEQSYKVLIAIGETLQSKGLEQFKFMITGYTDSAGSEKYNKALSLRRAGSVKTFLHTYFTIDDMRLIVKGMGELYPIASNENESGRARNRRVEIARLN